MSQRPLGPISWERIISAVDKARERLLRATAALENVGIAYAVVGRRFDRLRLAPALAAGAFASAATIAG